MNLRELSGWHWHNPRHRAEKINPAVVKTHTSVSFPEPFPFPEFFPCRQGKDCIQRKGFNEYGIIGDIIFFQCNNKVFIRFRGRTKILKVFFKMMKHIHRENGFLHQWAHQPLVMGFPFLPMRTRPAFSPGKSKTRNRGRCFSPYFMVRHFMYQGNQEIKAVQIPVYRDSGLKIFHRGPVIPKF